MIIPQVDGGETDESYPKRTTAASFPPQHPRPGEGSGAGNHFRVPARQPRSRARTADPHPDGPRQRLLSRRPPLAARTGNAYIAGRRVSHANDFHPHILAWQPAGPARTDGPGPALPHPHDPAGRPQGQRGPVPLGRAPAPASGPVLCRPLPAPVPAHAPAGNPAATADASAGRPSRPARQRGPAGLAAGHPAALGPAACLPSLARCHGSGHHGLSHQ